MVKKIFIGLFNIANIAINLKRGFEKLGYVADFFSSEKNLNSINYTETDTKLVKRIYSDNKNLFRKIFYHFLTIRILIKYNYFIFIPGSYTFFNKYSYEFRMLKLLKKKFCLICIGCDVRVPEHVMKYKWNPCKECDDDYKKFVGCVPREKKNKNQLLEKNFKIIFSPAECSGGFTKYFNILFPVSIPEIPSTIFSIGNDGIKIVHAPTSQIIKGTKYIENVLNSLKSNYDFEYIKLCNIPRNEVYKKLAGYDLVIDQILVGFYGVFAVEAMLLGKPVVCYIRDDIWDEIKDECPIYNANPDNLYDVLESILKNPEQLKERGVMSREYALKYHSPENVASYILSKLENN